MMELLHNPAFVLFGILFIGILLGNIRFCGLTLGSSGVLFVALAAGHFGLGVPEGVGGIGTALFVYCVGLSAGNRFFSSLAQAGNRLALLSLVVVTLGALTAAGLSYAFGIGPGMAAGMFAGACTSTPALAAAMESVPDAGSVNIGCGIAYPFGVAGVVLFVQLLPRLLKAELSREASAEENAQNPRKIVSLLVTIANPRIVGLRVADRDAAEHLSCRVTRVVRGGRLVPVTAGDTFEEGLEMLLVGARGDLERDALMLGTLQENRYPMDSERERAEVIALDRRFCGRTLRELRTLPKYGVTVSRVSRLGFSFVPTADTEIIRNDVLTVVGLPEHIEGFKKVTGHRCTAMNATDMLSLAGGIALGNSDRRHSVQPGRRRLVFARHGRRAARGRSRSRPLGAHRPDYGLYPPGDAHAVDGAGARPFSGLSRRGGRCAAGRDAAEAGSGGFSDRGGHYSGAFGRRVVFCQKSSQTECS